MPRASTPTVASPTRIAVRAPGRYRPLAGSVLALVGILLLSSLLPASAAVGGAGRPVAPAPDPATASPVAILPRAAAIVPAPAEEIPTGVNATADLTNGSLSDGNVLPNNVLGLTGAPIDVPLPGGGTVLAGLAEAGNASGADEGELYYASDSGHSLLTTAPTVYQPQAIAFDPTSEQLWIAGLGTLNGTTGLYQSLVAVNDLNFTTVAVGTSGNGSVAIVYDPLADQVAVADFQNDEILRYDASTVTYAGATAAGTTPVALAYDAPARAVLVADFSSDEVLVLNASSWASEGSISVPGGPNALAVSANGTAYVAQYSEAKAAVLNMTERKLVAEISTVANPSSVAVDPAAQMLLVGGNAVNLTLYNLSNSKRTNLPTGSAPLAVAYENLSGSIVVAEEGEDGLAWVDALSSTVSAQLQVGYDPLAITYDDTDGVVLATDYVSGSLTTLASNGYGFGTTAPARVFPGTTSATWVSTLDQAWFGGYYTGNISVVYGSNGSLATSFRLGGAPFGPTVFDPVNGTVITAGSTRSSTFTVLPQIWYSGPGATYPTVTYPISILYDPLNGNLYLGAGGYSGGASNATSQIEVFSTHTNSQVVRVIGGAIVAALVLDPVNGDVYGFNAYSDNVTVVSGTTNKIVRTIPFATPIAEVGSSAVYDPVTELVYITEPQLDQVWLFDPVSGNVVGKLAVGVGPEGIVYDYEGGYVAVANALSGTISILRDPARTAVVFHERGLPSGTSWSLVSGNYTRSSMASNISFFAESGTSAGWVAGALPGYQLADPNGTVSFAGGSTVVLVTYVSDSTSPVEFQETGLPVNARWAVDLDGLLGNLSSNTTGTSMVLSLHPGPFNYTIPGVPGYHATLPAGNFSVNGSRLVIGLTYVPTLYAVAFVETGLPSGTYWGVSLSVSLVNHSTSATVVVAAPNGTYTFDVIGIAGYDSTPTTGTLHIDGAPTTVPVAFNSSASTTQSGTSSASGLGGVLELGLVGLAALLVVVAFVVEWRQRRALRSSRRPADPAAGAPPP